MRLRSPEPVRLLPAVVGWAALAATALPAGSAPRAAVTGAFLLTCPGTAALLAARPDWLRPGSRPEMFSAAALAVALSAALSVLTAQALFLGHAFTVRRAVLALAALTTVLVLLPRRPLAQEDGGPRTDRAGRPGRRHGWWGAWLGAALMLGTAGCGGLAGGTGQHPPINLSGEGPQAAGAVVTDQPPSAGSWHQAFRDDFEGSGLDRTRWVTCYDWNVRGCTNAGNPEAEWYLPGQVSVAGGALTLTAERRTTAGSDGRSYPWVSGMVSTGRDHWDGAPRHTFTYGYVAAAIRAPADAVGMFPAFWLLPAATRGGLPELDIAEFINSNRYVDINLHALLPDGTEGSVHHQVGPTDFAAGYHVFGVDWQPDSITWYVDGEPKFKVTDHRLIPTVPMELLINLAVAYQQVPPSDVDSATLAVDWVAVWQR
ncbi:family 16 glycosylhydrolase [Kitasatospora sp. NPDC048365]|uniref:glycoside hydrolase family 16 protein n=1 Tax=Kitasatospora sp. NPDC048365 TaxID=3364050 RepID=UPI00371CF52E